MAGYVVVHEGVVEPSPFNVGDPNLLEKITKDNLGRRYLCIQVDGDEMAAVLWGLTNYKDLQQHQLLEDYHIPLIEGESFESMARNLKIFGEWVKKYNNTLLAGWPFRDEVPTQHQAVMIEAVFHELSIQSSSMDLPEKERWRLAGQIVARVRRDVENKE